MRRTAASAPGKVLLAGGYLVVDRAYTGLVLGLSARMHVVVQESTSAAPGNSTSGNDEAPSIESNIHIVVRSPQFREALWEYDCECTKSDVGVHLKQVGGTSTRNTFVETTLAYVLSYLSAGGASLGSSIVTILADDDYYSHATTATPLPQRPESRFRHFNVSLADAHKTGLGSSAALVTALTAALLFHYHPANLLRHPVWGTDASRGPTEANDASPISSVWWRKRIHNLAQAAHCAAQGKIGSGFDVGCAVYGSCIYRRFSPSVLTDVGELNSPGFTDRLRSVIEDHTSVWDAEFDSSSVAMPRGLRLLMCDVDCGSSTPGMVKQVFKWRAEHPEAANSLWAELQRGTQALAASLKSLADTETAGQAVVDTQERGIVMTIDAIRTHVRAMSKSAGVPIEPPAQTALLNECVAQPGVIGGVVPGAGGYDALALLVRDEASVVDALAQCLKTYVHQDTEGDAVKMGQVRLLSVREEMDGMAPEELDLYEGWLEA